MFWYNGEIIDGNSLTLNINEPGLLYGATAFTTLRVYQKSLKHPLTHWSDHCQRLEKSLQDFDWKLPNWQQLEQGAEILKEEYPILRITIFPDGKEWIAGRFLPPDLSPRQSQGIRGWLATEPLYKRSLPEYKTGNYLAAWLAQQQAQKMAAQEAILLDLQEHWLETSTGNLWGWKDNTYFTPALDQGILAGISRQNLLNWLKSQNMDIQENQWTADFVQGLEGIAYSNSVVEIIPFREICSRNFYQCYTVNHPCLKQIQAYFKSYSDE